MIKTTNKVKTPRAGVMGRDCQMSKAVNGAGPASEPAAPRNPIRILRLSQVVEKTGLGKTTLYELRIIRSPGWMRKCRRGSTRGLSGFAPKPRRC
jgi:hypothetical protein